MRGVSKIGAIAGLLVLTSLADAEAQQKSIKIGMTLPFTGADAENAAQIKNGAMMAIDEANAKEGFAGHKIDVVMYDTGTVTTGQYDPAQAATTARMLVADQEVVANIGPQMSGEGKAMTPILSEADLATITPSSTNPDITNPAMAAQFKPEGRTIYFRTVTTDAYQGPFMANYLLRQLKVKTVFVLDDSGAYGIGIADSFQKQAETIGLKVLGRDQLVPKDADYSAVLTRIKALKPDALYYGGAALAGVKLAKQSHDIVPDMIKAGGDGMGGASVAAGVGFPAIEGWYYTSASPHMTGEKAAKDWVKSYEDKYKSQPSDYSITAYDAALVVLDAIKRVAQSRKEINRTTVRQAIQEANVETMQGVVSFDANGDINDRTVSVFQFSKNPNFPDDDYVHQHKYLGPAPQS